MIKSIRYENFKRYNSAALSLDRRITILVGPNSSGKSSLLKGLLAFKQTYEDPTDHAGFVAEGAYVDIGHFEEYVKDHNHEGEVGFIFEISGPFRLSSRVSPSKTIVKVYVEIVHEEDPQTKHGRVSSYAIYFIEDGAKINEGDFRNSKLYIIYRRMQKAEEFFKIDVSEDLFGVFYSPRKARSGAAAQPDEKLTAEAYARLCSRLVRGDVQAQRDNQRGMLLGVSRGSYDETIEALLFFERYTVQNIHAQLVDELTKRLFALAALREKPSRSVKRTDERWTVGSKGENTASVYFALRQRAIKAGKRNSSTQDDFSRLNNWFQMLKLGREIEINSWRDLIDMRTRTNTSSSQSDSVVDIGVGFSQAAPILVQLAVMADDAMLITEQPELHLYPWAQTKLGQIFCEESFRTRKRIVIETHSEHLIGGVQLHLSKSRLRPASGLRPDDVQVLYVDSDASIKKLEIDEYGEFRSEWPSGFFDETIRTYREIMRNKVA